MKFIKRSCVLLLSMLLVLTILPTSIPAAATPKFQTKRTYIYENYSAKYTLKNVSKGQLIKWSLSGSGKSYARLKITDARRATGSTISNSISINTKGNSAAQNKTVTLVAKVYDKKGNYLTKVTTSSKIKIPSTDIAITGGASDNTTYYVDTPYQFGTSLTPKNSTDTVKWTVTNAQGTEVSSLITSKGVFSTATACIYTIEATSYCNSKFRSHATKTIQVKERVSAISQTGLNTFKVQVPAELVSKLTKDSFKITASNGTTTTVKSIESGSDNFITVTTYNNFFLYWTVIWAGNGCMCSSEICCQHKFYDYRFFF